MNHLLHIRTACFHLRLGDDHVHKNRTHLALLFVMALCLALLPACAGGGKPAPVADDTQVEEQVPTNPLDGITAESRVVAISRPAGELWLLSGGQLAGVTEDALELKDLPKDVTSVGDATQPDLDEVLALEPELVLILEDESSHKELEAGLMGAEVPVLAVDVDSFDEYATIMQALTTATGRADLYEKNVTDVQVRIDEVVAHNMLPDRGTYLAMSVSPAKATALDSDNIACNILNDLGMTNLTEDGSADEVSFEIIAQTNPDWIFVLYEGDQAESTFENQFVSHPMWSQVEAVKQGHVVALPNNLFQFPPNTRWAEAYGYISQVLHGSWA